MMSKVGRRELKETLRHYDAVHSGDFDQNYISKDQLKLAKLRLYDIEKTGRDFFGRYKSARYILRDFLQPFKGISDVLMGMIKFAGFPLLALCGALYYLCVTKETRYPKSILGRIAPIMADGAAQILLGVVQIIKAPFTWALQIPFRCVLTAYKGWLPMKERAGIVALKQSLEQVTSDPTNLPKNITVLSILFRLNEKCYKELLKNTDMEMDDGALSLSAKRLGETMVKYEGEIPVYDWLNVHKAPNRFFMGHSSQSIFRTSMKNIDSDAPFTAEAAEHANAIMNGI